MVRFASSVSAAALLVALGSSTQAAGQDIPAAQAAPTDSAAAIVTSPAAIQQPVLFQAARPEPRPAALVPLYASFVALQVLDLHSTAYALDRGAAEANPAMRGFVDNRLAMTALKATGTAGVIYVSERLRTKNKAASLGLMIATNVAMTWVVQHNYRAVR
jgi:hypothetical protein